MQIYQWIDVTRQTIKQLCMSDKAAKKNYSCSQSRANLFILPPQMSEFYSSPVKFWKFSTYLIFDLPFLLMIGFKLSPSPNDRDRCLSKGAFDLEGNSETWIKISFCNDLWRGLSIVISLLRSCWCKQRVCVWSNLPSYRHNRIVVVFSRSFASETDIGQLLFFFVSAYIGPSDVLITIIRETTMKMQSSVSKLDASLRFLNAVFLSGNINCERPRLNRHSVTRCCKVRRCNHIPWLFAGLNLIDGSAPTMNFPTSGRQICWSAKKHVNHEFAHKKIIASISFLCVQVNQLERATSEA